MNSFTKQFVALALVTSIAGGAVVAYPDAGVVDTVVKNIKSNPALRTGLPVGAAATFLSLRNSKTAMGKTALRSAAVIGLLATLHRCGLKPYQNRATNTFGRWLLKLSALPKSSRIYLFASIAALTHKLVTRVESRLAGNPRASRTAMFFKTMELFALIYLVEEAEITKKVLRALGK